jgi:defect-in-organelle-trafficking protein DotC
MDKTTHIVKHSYPRIKLSRLGKVLLVSCWLLSLSACASHRNQEIDPTNLYQLQSLRDDTPINQPGGTQDTNSLRIKALEDTAMSLSAQGGLAWSSKQINARLQHDKWYLETVYNFNGMMLSHGVLPPVLAQGDNSLNLADPDTIRVADKTYKIVQQARFATTPPNWRDYLWMPFTKPELPHKFLLPKTAAERKVWARAIAAGWGKGIQQATSIFQQNLARLKRDYQGMILYRKLLEQKMISAPYVSRTEMGVTGDGSDMRINDQVLRITEHPQLQTDSHGWKAILVKQDDNI